MGTKAGRERYAQIVKVAQMASQRLEEYSARNDARAEDADDAGDRLDPSEQETSLGGSRVGGVGDRAFARYPPAETRRERRGRPR
jgi:hypothetical protein